MLTFEEMIFRLAIAAVLGAIVGIERDLAGKEAGLRTDIMVASGAAIFSMVSVVLPYIVATSPENLPEVIARNSGFLGVIANIVIGVGFLGAGIIVKQGIHVRGLTTAATVWFVAAVGVLCGIGLIKFAAASTLGLTFIIFILRKWDVYRAIKRGDAEEN